MSWLPTDEPSCTTPGTSPEASAVELVVTARPRDLGGFSVGRVLPSAQRRLVGPFVFFDHMTRHELAPGHGMDVRPHPHIGLATVTYLFDGEILHRDSLGSRQPIVPGDVNWMSAGRGIVHSERTGDDGRKSGGVMHGIQSWVALPVADEETAPRFEHHPGATHSARRAARRAVADPRGVRLRARSPAGVRSPTFYVHAELEDGAELEVTDEHEERAGVRGRGGARLRRRAWGPGRCSSSGAARRRRSERAAPARVMLLGGASLPGERHMFWNFVSSSRERIERAKDEWKRGAFPRVPGDEVEFIPLPE